MRDHDVTLPDGRTASVVECGDPTGVPVVYLHGAASSRLEARCFDSAARDLGVRVIAPDRPGRTSSATPAASPVAYAHEVRDLADLLGLDRFVVAGQSNGGMFACAVGAELGEQVTKVVPINPTVPVSRADVRRSLTPLVRLSYGYIARFPEHAARSVARRGFSAPSGALGKRDPDRDRWTDPSSGPVLEEIAGQPVSAEYVLSELRSGISDDWGFDHLTLEQPVEFFAGDRDGSLSYVRTWAERLPDAVVHEFTGGHIGHLRPDVVRSLLGRIADVREATS